MHLQAELYNEYAAEDKLLNFQEFYELYKVERSKIEVKQTLHLFKSCTKELSSDVFEDEYLDDYVKAIFRFDKTQRKVQ